MKRYLALDAMRGLTIAAMILVNTPGDWSNVYSPLLHSQWHGLTATDLVFPFFLFIVGSAMFFTYKKIDCQLSSKTLIQVLKRSTIIFALGLMLNAFPFNDAFENLRLMGVLQRIALCYLFASISVLLFDSRHIKILILAILIVYSAILAITGYTLDGNLVQWLDLKLLGANHMYALHGAQFDPEGILSSIPGIASTLIGYEVTRELTKFKESNSGVRQLLIVACIFVVVGYLLSLVIPINKSLWTMTYVLVSSGFACLILAMFVVIADINNFKIIITPFLVFGLNPLFIYVVSWLWESSYKLISMPIPGSKNSHFGEYLQFNLTQLMSPVNASLFYALAHVTLFWILSYWLYKKHIIIKI